MRLAAKRAGLIGQFLEYEKALILLANLPETVAPIESAEGEDPERTALFDELVAEGLLERNPQGFDVTTELGRNHLHRYVRRGPSPMPSADLDDAEASEVEDDEVDSGVESCPSTQRSSR